MGVKWEAFGLVLPFHIKKYNYAKMDVWGSSSLNFLSDFMYICESGSLHVLINFYLKRILAQNKSMIKDNLSMQTWQLPYNDLKL